jgi:hypothetical protein
VNLHNICWTHLEKKERKKERKERSGWFKLNHIPAI